MPDRLFDLDAVEKTAVISPCGAYRYRLTRRWADGPSLAWVMLNPSTADATVDDPTIRRVIGFSKAHGAGAAIVVNLYALRATDPAELDRHPDPVGPENDRYLEELVDDDDIDIVCAWGAHPAARRRIELGVLNLLSLSCLGTTKAGHPRHPLYVPSEQRLEPFLVVA